VSAAGMLGDLERGLSFQWNKEELLGLIEFPLSFIFKLYPMTLVFIVMALLGQFRHYRTYQGWREAYLALSLALINFIPYWISSLQEPRYIMPIYPLVALFLGLFFWNTTKKEWVVFLCGGLLLIKVLLVCLFFPIYSHEFRGNYASLAAEVITVIHNEPLYYQDISATGETVLMNIDEQRAPLPPLRWNPSLKGAYFVVKDPEDRRFDQKRDVLIHVYRFGRSGEFLYLYHHQK
jgi:hypothetical protein